MADRGQSARKSPAAASHRRPWWHWALLGLGALVALGAAIVSITVLTFAADPELPRINAVADYRPKVVTRVLAAGGELLGEIYEERRTVVPRERIAPVMIHALVDAEDAQFYEHDGLSYWGMFRALLDDLRPGARIRGASTLTQQLVRNLILKSSTRAGMAGVKRKVQEMILARRLESRLSKDEILTLYLNQIDFPYQRFGIEEAARFYFGKSVADVDAGEAALLASLPKGPTEIDPWRHPERAKDRQRYVLSQMVRYHHLSPADAERFGAAPIRLVKAAAPALGSAPEIVDEVRRRLVQRYGQKSLATLGATVTTSCDARIQKLAREAVEKGLVELDGRQGYRKALGHLKGAQLSGHLKKLEHDLPGGPPRDRIVEGVVLEVTPGEGMTLALGAKSGWLPLPTAVDRYNPKALPVEKRFVAGDVVRVRVVELPKEKPPLLALEAGPQAAVVVIDPTTRQVKAIVGGYGYRPGGFDRALMARRQPGSAFKPFVYAAAFRSGRFTPASVLIDGPQTYVSPGLAPWKPQNAEKEEFRGAVRLRYALAHSLNTVASQLVDTSRGGVDPREVAALASQLGIESPLTPNPALALGTSVVTPFELTNAYASFAASGRRQAAQLIIKINDELEPAAPTAAVLKPDLDYLIVDMMRSVIEEGTAAQARGKLGRPAVGKTGTTNLDKKRPDAWFVGFTPQLVAGVWVGFDDMRDLGHGEQGARAALPIWIELMQGAHKGLPPMPFVQPPGMVVQKIDPATGLLAAPGAPALDELFLDGTQPTEVAPAAGEANPDTFIVDQTQ